MAIKNKLQSFALWSEKYTQTDMRYVIKGSFWVVAGRLGLLLVSLATMAAFARLLPQDTYGAYRYILSVLVVLQIFSLPGMRTVLVRGVAQGRKYLFYSTSYERFRWSWIGSLLSGIVAAWYLFHGNTEFASAFLLAGIALPFLSAVEMFASFWQGQKRFDKEAIHWTLWHFLSGIILIAVLFITDSLLLILATYYIPRIFIGLYFFLLAKKDTSQQERIAHDNTEKKDDLAYGKHLTVLSAPQMIVDQIDKIILWQFLGPIPVALYAFAQMPIVNLRYFIPIVQLSLPKLSEQNITKIKGRIYQKFLRLFPVVIAFTIFVMLVGPFVYRILFPTYLEAIPYFQVLALGFLFLPFKFLEVSLMGEKREKELYIIRFSFLIVQLSLFFLLTPLFGLWGLIGAILLAQTFESALTFYFFQKS